MEKLVEGVSISTLVSPIPLFELALSSLSLSLLRLGGAYVVSKSKSSLSSEDELSDEVELNEELDLDPTDKLLEVLLVTSKFVIDWVAVANTAPEKITVLY